MHIVYSEEVMYARLHYVFIAAFFGVLFGSSLMMLCNAYLNKWSESPEIAVIDIDEMMKTEMFFLNNHEHSLDNEKHLLRNYREKYLEAANQFAKRKNLLIFDKKALIAGAHDVSLNINNELMRKRNF